MCFGNNSNSTNIQIPEARISPEQVLFSSTCTSDGNGGSGSGAIVTVGSTWGGATSPDVDRREVRRSPPVAGRPTLHEVQMLMLFRYSVECLCMSMCMCSVCVCVSIHMYTGPLPSFPFLPQSTNNQELQRNHPRTNLHVPRPTRRSMQKFLCPDVST